MIRKISKRRHCVRVDACSDWMYPLPNGHLSKQILLGFSRFWYRVSRCLKITQNRIFAYCVLFAPLEIIEIQATNISSLRKSLSSRSLWTFWCKSFFPFQIQLSSRISATWAKLHQLSPYVTCMYFVMHFYFSVHTVLVPYPSAGNWFLTILPKCKRVITRRTQQDM